MILSFNKILKNQSLLYCLTYICIEIIKEVLIINIQIYIQISIHIYKAHSYTQKYI